VYVASNASWRTGITIIERFATSARCTAGRISSSLVSTRTCPTPSRSFSRRSESNELIATDVPSTAVDSIRSHCGPTFQAIDRPSFATAPSSVAWSATTSGPRIGKSVAVRAPVSASGSERQNQPSGSMGSNVPTTIVSTGWSARRWTTVSDEPGTSPSTAAAWLGTATWTGPVVGSGQVPAARVACSASDSYHAKTVSSSGASSSARSGSV
jgi:hypothetical protein